MNLLGVAKGGGLAWTFSQSILGQTITILFFAVGAVLAFLSNPMLMHKLIPAALVVLLLAFSSYSAVASRALLASPALMGIASHSSRPVLKLVHLVLLGLGAYEIFALFS